MPSPPSRQRTRSRTQDRALQPGLSKPAGRQTGPAKKTQLHAFAIVTSEVTPVRLGAVGRIGGVGVIDIAGARRGMPGVNASGLVVTIPAPNGMTILRAATETSHKPAAADPNGAWQCAPTAKKGQRCTYHGDLTSGHVPMPLRAWVRANAVLRLPKKGKVHVTPSAAWVEDRVAEEHDGVSGADPVVGTRVQRAPSGVWLTTDLPVTVEIHGHGKGILSVDPTGDAEQRTGNLAGTIEHIDGRPVKAEWAQISGPPVKFLDPVTRVHATHHLGMPFEVPSGIANGTKLGFRLTVSGDGWATAATTTVTIRSMQVGHFDPRKALVQEAFKNSAKPKAPRSGAKVPRASYATSIGGQGTRRATVGSTVVLDFRHTSPIKSVIWTSVTPATGNLIKTAQRSGNKIAFTAPNRPMTFTVRAVATLKDGRKISRTKLVTIVPNVNRIGHPGRPVGRSSASAAAAGTAADAASAKMFCAMKAGTTVTFSDKASLTLPSNYVRPAKCGATSSASFTGATFIYSGTTLGNASGMISGKGVSLNNVTFAVPANLQKYLPSSVTSKTLSLTAPTGAAVSAPFSKGVAGAFSGSFKSNAALNFLPLPAGWTAPALAASLASVGGAATFTLTVESAATDGTGGSAQFTLTAAKGGASDVVVNASNIAVLQATSGNQLDANVNGTFSLSNPNTLSATLSCPTPAANGCQLASNFWLANNTTLAWASGGGLTLSKAGVTVGTGSNLYQFTVSGNYSGTSNWSLSVDSGANSWALGNSGIALTNFAGNISETPAASGSAAAAASTSTFTVGITSQVTGLTMDSWLGTPTITGSIGNTCPAGVPASVCSPGNVVVAVQVTNGQATVDGTSVPYSASALVNLSTMALTFDSTATINTSFGPSEFNITSLTMSLQGSPGAMTLGFTTSGTVLGQTANLVGSFGPDGYYLAGNLSSFNSGGISADGGVSFGYSSYTTNVTLPGNSAATNLPATTIVVTGGYTLPASVTSSLGLPAGSATFTGQLNTTADSFSASLQYTLANPAILVGTTTTTNLTLSSVAVTVSGGTSGVSFSTTVVGAVNTPASGNNAASTTPVAGTIGITVGGSGGASLDLQLGVDTDQITGPTACTDGNSADVCDAFGVQGLDVNTLAIAGTFAATSPSVSFNADVFLPDTWTTGILVGSPQIALGFDLSMATPCITFTVGAADSSTNVIDIGGGGALTGTYLNLVFAPSGCQLPNGDGTFTNIPVGMAFNFNGAILGTSTQVNINADIKSTGIAISGNLNVGAFTLAGASVQQTVITFDIDTTVPKYQFSFSGGISVGSGAAGGSAQATGNIDIQPGTLQVNLSGSGSLSLAGLSASLTGFYFNIDYSNGTMQSLAVGGNLSISVLGVGLYGSIGFQYADGGLLAFHVGIGASLNFYVGSVGGTVYVDYCKGSLGNEPTSSTSCTTDPTAYGGTTTFETYFDGQFQVGVCGDHWYDVCYTKDYSDVIVDKTWGNPAAPDPVPGAPAAPTGTPGAQQAVVSWSIPNNIGGSGITGYSLQQSSDGGNTWSNTSVQPSGTNTSVTIPGLTDGTSYQFQVAAVNSGGTSPYSAASGPVVPWSPQPLIANMNLANPGNLTQFASTDAASYDLDLMWNQGSAIANLANANGANIGQATSTVMVSSVAPATFNGNGGWTVEPCESPTVGFQWLPTAGNTNPAATNVAPITTTCAIQVVYSSLQSNYNGLNGLVPAAEFADSANPGTDVADLSSLAQNGNSSTAWNTPTTAYAVCFPQGASGTIPAQHCELYNPSSLSSMGAVQNAASTDYTAPYVQMLNGTISPLGVQPSGMTLAVAPNSSNGAQIWSPDGQSVLTAGTYPAWGSGCPNDTCGYIAVKTGGSFPNIGNNLQFNIGGLQSAPQSLWVDSAAGKWNVELANGSVINPYNAQVQVQPGAANAPYLFVQNGLRLWSGSNCAPGDWYSQCGAVGSSTPGPMSLLNGNNPPCLNAPDFNGNTTTTVATCNNSQGQQLYFDDTVYTGTGRILIGSTTPSNSNGNPGACLDTGGGTTPGTAVRTWYCNGAASQQWQVTDTGTIVNNASGLCLDANGNSGTNTQLWTCNGTAAQEWTRQSAANFG